MQGSTADTASTPQLLELLQVLAVRQQWFERSMAASMGVDRTSLEVLYHLVIHGPSTPTEIARYAHLSTALTAQVLKRLEAGEHITRSRHPKDRRKVMITIRAETAALAEEHVRPIINELGLILQQADSSSLTTIADFLRTAAGVYTRAAGSLS